LLCFWNEQRAKGSEGRESRRRKEGKREERQKLGIFLGFHKFTSNMIFILCKGNFS
jgi:hypothetical protein